MPTVIKSEGEPSVSRKLGRGVAAEGGSLALLGSNVPEDNNRGSEAIPSLHRRTQGRKLRHVTLRQRLSSFILIVITALLLSTLTSISNIDAPQRTMEPPPPVQFKGKEELLKTFHGVLPSSKSPVPVTPEKIAQKYGIQKTPRTVKCQINGTTHVGWIPASSTTSPSNHSDSLIPRFIFQSWKTNELKEKICNNALAWIHLNPEYDYFLFDDAAVDRFIQLEYGEDIYLAYSCVNVGAAKCDVWRLLVIYFFGGIYFDIDVRTKSPFAEWDFGNRTVVTGKGCGNRHHPTGCGHQWGLIYTPFHSVMHAAIEETLGNLASRQASHVYDVSFWAFYNAWTKGPFNSSYMPGWGDLMGNRVIFFDKEAKAVMIEDSGLWTEANSQEKIWKSACIDKS